MYFVFWALGTVLAHILKLLTQPACPASPKYGRGQLGSIWGKKSLPSPFPFLLYLFYEIQGKKINFICCYVTSTDDILSHCCLPAAGWTHLLRTQFRDFILIILGWTGVPTYQGIGQMAICNIIMAMDIGQWYSTPSCSRQGFVSLMTSKDQSRKQLWKWSSSWW